MKAEGNRKLKIFIKGVSFQRKCGVSRGGGGEGEGEGVLEDNFGHCRLATVKSF